MLNYDPSVNLIHYPLPMARFGLNPYGGPRYRIVTAQSRRNLVGGFWRDNGAIEYRWAPTYREIQAPDDKGPPIWIMEVWDTCRMSRSRWDTLVDPVSGWLLNGPYPDRGEYYHCFTFSCPIVDANLDKLIAWIEEGQKRSWQDNLDACKKEYEDETKDRQGRMDAIVRNALPAYCGAPFSGGRVARGSKTAPVMLTADQVRLPNGRPAPLGNNKFVNMPRRRRKVA